MRMCGLTRPGRRRAAASILLASFTGLGNWAAATTYTWSGTGGDNNWVVTSNEINWGTTAGTYPGSLSGVTNMDTALFNTATTGMVTININQGPLNIDNINFDTSAGSYIIGSTTGNQLLLTAGGGIAILSTLTAGSKTETIAAPLVLEGNASFTNSGTNGTTVLDISGTVTAAASTTDVLTLSGTNTGANTVLGSLGDGTTAGDNFSLVKSGAGFWMLSGADAYTGTTSVTGGALILNNASALGNSSGVSVSNGAAVQLTDGLTITGKTITIVGNGTDNSGALKTTGSSTWAGNIILGADQARLGTSTATGVLTINGTISSGSNVWGPAIRVFAAGGTVLFDNPNTYLGMTSVVAGNLKIGVVGALPATTTVQLGNAANVLSATLDLNGLSPTVTGLSTVASDDIVSTVTTSSGTPVLTLSNSSTTSNPIFGSTGVITGAVSIVKTGAGTQTFANANSSTYTGNTTILAGTLSLDASVAPASAQSGSASFGNFITNSTPVLQGGTLSLKGRPDGTTTSLTTTAALSTASTTVSVSSTTGLAVGQPISGPGIPSGDFIYSINSATSVSLQTSPTANTASGATLTLTTTNSTTSQTFNNGTVLGPATSSVVSLQNGGDGTTLNLGTITRPAPRNLVPGGGAFDVSSATTGVVTTISPNANFSGGSSTILGGYATYGGVTWAVSAGDGTNAGALSPLPNANYTVTTTDFGTTPTVSGADVDVQGSNATTTTSAVAVNSLRFNTNTPSTGTVLTLGGATTIATGGILVTSNATSGGTIQGGSLTSGNGTDLIIFDNAAGNFSINSTIIGSIGVTKVGSGQYVTNAQSTYTGPTTLLSGSVVPQSSSTGSPGAVISGPFGTGTLVLAGAQFRGTSSNAITIANNVTLAADTTIPSSSTTTLTLSGPVTLVNGSRTITDNSGGDVVFSGSIGDLGDGYGFTKAGASSRLIFSGANTYLGNTAVNGGLLIINNTTGSGTGTGTVNVNTTGTLGGKGFITGPVNVNAGTTTAGGIITGGNGVSASSTPGNLTTTGGTAPTTFSQTWNGASSTTLAGDYVTKFNPNNLGNSGATVDPGGRGANWDELTMTTLDLVASATSQFDITTVSITPTGTVNPFNPNSSYAWPIAVITSGVSGFYVNGAPAVSNTSSTPQADLAAAIVPLLRLDPTGLLAATGVSNANDFSLGVAPDPSNSAFEDIVISYSATPEPTSLFMLGIGATGFLLRRKRRVTPG